MKKKNLYCLVDNKNQHVTLDLIKIEDTSGGIEIDLKDKKWRYGSNQWYKIGESKDGHVKLVFNIKNFEQLKYAFKVAQDFQR